MFGTFVLPKLMPSKKTTFLPSLNWDQVRAWRLERNHLLERAPRRQVERVVADVGGIHAQLMSAAELSLATRVDGIRPTQVRAALWEKRTLIKTWCMRGTLHLLPASELPLYVAALRPRTEKFLPAWLRAFEVTRDEVERLLEGVRAALDDRCLTRNQLADEVARITKSPKLGEKVRGSWGTFLKPAAYRGYLCFGPSQGQNVTFVRPDQWVQGWRDSELDSGDALKEIARRFLATFGPAKPDDFARWWWGAPLPAAKPLIKALVEKGEIEEVEVKGYRAWMLKSNAARIAKTESSGSVRLLPHFDCYVMGFQPRDYLITKEHRAKVFRPQAWISPVLLINGEVAGIWEQQRRGDQIKVSVELFRGLSSAEKKRVAEEADRLGAFLGGSAQVAFM